jgi:hypothetical protein
MNDYRMGGLEMPLSHHNDVSSVRWSLWVLVIVVLMFASYAMIFGAARARLEHTSSGTVAASWPPK